MSDWFDRNRVMRKIESVFRGFQDVLKMGVRPTLFLPQAEIGNADSLELRTLGNGYSNAHKFLFAFQLLVRIYELVKTNTYATKRELFDEFKHLYINQGTLESVINNLSHLLQECRENLRVRRDRYGGDSQNSNSYICGSAFNSQEFKLPRSIDSGFHSQIIPKVDFGPKTDLDIGIDSKQGSVSFTTPPIAETSAPAPANEETCVVANSKKGSVTLQTLPVPSAISAASKPEVTVGSPIQHRTLSAQPSLCQRSRTKRPVERSTSSNKGGGGTQCPRRKNFKVDLQKLVTAGVLKPSDAQLTYTDPEDHSFEAKLHDHKRLKSSHDGKYHKNMESWLRSVLNMKPRQRAGLDNEMKRVLCDRGSMLSCMRQGVITSEGELWKEQRRFALSTLRDFGVGRPVIEPRIKEESEHLIERISEYASNGKPWDPFELLSCAIANIISLLVFGKRFSYDDQEIAREFKSAAERLTTSGVSFLSPMVLSDVCFWLMQLSPTFRKVDRETEKFREFVERHVMQAVSEYDPDVEPSNYVHAFMKAAKENQGNYFTDRQLSAMAFELFAAGSETTSTTLRWAVLFLVRHPEIQERLYREIRHEVGLSHLPSYADRTKLPFTEAVIMETQRLANLAPLGVLRRTLAPTKLMGYDIPEDSMVVPLLTNVLQNPDIYPDPYSFDPQRFLDADGKVIRDPKWIPFQTGKRICLGEPLARMELFLVLTALVSRFRFSLLTDQPPPTMKPNVGILSSPMRFQVQVEARND